MCIQVEVKRRVTNKNGQRYSDDMVVMTGNAACSIALRNATFRVVPLALVKPVYEAAKKVAIGDAKTLVSRRADALAHFAKMGVHKESVCLALEVKAVEDIGLEQLETLIGYANAIRDKETSIDEVFNPKKLEAIEKKGLGEIIGKDASAKDVGNDAKQPPANPVTKVPVTPVKTYTAEARQAILKEVEGLMLDHGVPEAKVMLHVHAQKLAQEGQDEVGALSTAVLDGLRAVIPTRKK